uniref:Reticulocalbin-3 n=1 Tax=Dermanyssus gallinae TaxID=34641 RepID=A0A679PJD2_9ACAR|nr:TPA_exp: calumenin [Dermanyssus gallinae]
MVAMRGHSMSYSLLFCYVAVAFLGSVLGQGQGQPQGVKAPASNDPTKPEHSHEPPPQYYQPPDPKRVKAALEKLFDEKLDANKDNYVDQQEMKAWIKVVHGSMVSDNVDRQWDYFEKNLKDGSLQWEDYRKVTFSDEEKATLQPEEQKTYEDQLFRTERRWKHADDNGDGLLTKSEFQAFLHPEEDPTKSDIVVTESIEMMDTDKDKIVSLQEYMEHLKSVAGPEKNDDSWLKEQQAHFTTYLDKNKDGSLDWDEMKQWVIPQVDREEGEAWRLISYADEDRDMKLTRTDIVQNSEHYQALLPNEFWSANAHRHDGAELGQHSEL